MAIVTIFNSINCSGIYMFCGFGRMGGCGFVGMMMDETASRQFCVKLTHSIAFADRFKR
jgi:hypothetical protein